MEITSISIHLIPKYSFLPARAKPQPRSLNKLSAQASEPHRPETLPPLPRSQLYRLVTTEHSPLSLIRRAPPPHLAQRPLKTPTSSTTNTHRKPLPFPTVPCPPSSSHASPCGARRRRRGRAPVSQSSPSDSQLAAPSEPRAGLVSPRRVAGTNSRRRRG